jgi:hypothetical protein
MGNRWDEVVRGAERPHVDVGPVIDSLESTSNDMKSLFSDAQAHRDDILANVRFPSDDWRGQSYAVVYPTKYCPVGCEHCYFASPKPSRELTGFIRGDDTKALLPFIDSSDADVLQITGGGEPLLELDTVVELVRNSRANRIDIHTSAVTLASMSKASEAIERLFVAFSSSPSSGRLTFRVSLDEFHLEKMGQKAIDNVIAVFRAHYARYARAGFFLKLHSIIGDMSIPRMMSSMGEDIVDLEYAEENEYRKSLGKPMPSRAVFRDGSAIDLDYSLRMLSDSVPDMDNVAKVDEAIAAYDGLRLPNPAVHLNADGRKGLCYIVHEDGNVELWNTGLRDNVTNTSRHTFAQFRESVFSDVIQVAAIEKKAAYVEALLAEVNIPSIRRAKAIGSGTHFHWDALVDPMDRLYVSIRVIQDYLFDGGIRSVQIERLNPLVRSAIALSPIELRRLYSASRSGLPDAETTDATTVT